MKRKLQGGKVGRGLAQDAARGKRFAIVTAGFHRDIGERLLRGARRTLAAHGADPEWVEEFWVPGCFEIPLALKRLAATGRYQGLIALGLVMRGATPHFDYVAGEASRGIALVAYDFGIPVGFGVLTTLHLKQALERSGGRVGNKGAEAATACLEMVALLERINHGTTA